MNLFRIPAIVSCLFLAAGAGLAKEPEYIWQSFAGSAGKTGMFEPSGVRQLNDGRIVIVQDEASDAFGTLVLGADGAITDYNSLLPATEPSFWQVSAPPSPPAFEDFEGVALGADGYIYALTSHSRTRSGNRHAGRERFLRLRLEGEKITEFSVYGDLRKALRAAFPVLKEASQSQNPKGREGLNIESLCFDAKGRSLLIGLRGPVDGGDTLIVVLENPEQVFQGDDPRFSPNLIRLDMNKQGLRAMSFIPALGGYLLIGQKAKVRGSSNRNFHLWSWGGGIDDPAIELKIPGLDLRKTEGIAQIRHLGRDYLLLVSDDGTRRDNSPAHYVLVAVETIAEHLRGR